MKRWKTGDRTIHNDQVVMCLDDACNEIRREEEINGMGLLSGEPDSRYRVSLLLKNKKVKIALKMLEDFGFSAQRMIRYAQAYDKKMVSWRFLPIDMLIHHCQRDGIIEPFLYDTDDDYGSDSRKMWGVTPNNKTK